MSQLKLAVITDPSRFRAGMSAIQKDLFKLRKTADTVGRGMNKALSAVGLAAGFTALTNVLKDSSRAASEDIKSQALLANSLRNTIGANEDTVKSAEAYIKRTQLQTSVLDDELRPALDKAVRATGYLSSGQALLDNALNVSAGTGKDLNNVTTALAKAYNGNYTSLKKLVPGIELTSNFMTELNSKFAGAAETAAKNDPYKRIQVIFADLQETIGLQLLPALEQFSAYLSSPEGQSNLKQIASIFSAIGQFIANSTSFLIQNIAVVKSVVAAVVFLKLTWFAVIAAVKLYDIATKIAAISTKALKYALISTGIGAIIVAVGTLAATWFEVKDNTDAAADSMDEYATNPNIASAIQWTNDLRDRLLGQKKATEDAAKELADAIRKALDSEMSKMKSTAEKFRDTVDLAFGTFGKDENSVFNIDVIIAKMRRVATAAKGFAQNIAKLRAKKVPQAVIDQLVAMGPAQGNIVAKGLLASGSKLSTFLGLSEQLYGTGVSVAGQQAITPNATYEININKAVITAADIIREIRTYEKKTGRKYLVG